VKIRPSTLTSLLYTAADASSFHPQLRAYLHCALADLDASNAKTDQDLAAALRRRLPQVSTLPDTVRALLTMRVPSVTLGQLILPDVVGAAVRDFVEEQRCADALSVSGADPRHKLLLSGPTGCGKTALAGAIAHGLNRPFYVMRTSGVVESHMGETSRNLAKVFDFVSSHPCVVLIDEVDGVATRRDDKQEVAELRRIVGFLLQAFDALPTHTVIVAATNLPKCVDGALVRRFDARLHLPIPSAAQVLQYLARFALDPIALEIQLPPAVSYADLAQLEAAVRRAGVLGHVPQVEEGLARWERARQAANI